MQRSLVAAVGLLLTLAARSEAQATPLYSLTIQDVGAGVSQTESGTGTVSYSGNIGGFSITALNVTDLNPTNPMDVDFGSQDIFSANGADTLKVYVTVSDLTTPLPSMLTIGTTSQANFQGSKLMGWSSQTYFDPNNDTGTAGLVDRLSGSSGGIVTNGFLTTTAGQTMLTETPFSYTVEFTLKFLTSEFANGAGASTDIILAEPSSWLSLIIGFAVIVLLRVGRMARRTGLA
jgi:hypothetical protein